MANKDCFFSIITITLNEEKNIQATIQSVLEQSCRDFEIIIKDGGSTDKTLELIPDSDKITVVRQKDTGIYDAMNQGIAHATGKFVCFLNSGDRFENKDVLSAIREKAELLENFSGVIYGDFVRHGVYCKQHSSLTRKRIFWNCLQHQTIFYSRCLFDKYGCYDTEYKIFGDYELTLRLFTNGVEHVHLAYPVCDYLGGGLSETPKNQKIKEAERRKVLKKYFTKSERIVYGLSQAITLPGLRAKISGDNSPMIIRKLYRGAVNLIKR